MEENILILRNILENGESTQRDLANAMSISLGKLNSKINKCIEDGYLRKNEDSKYSSRLSITDKGMELLDKYRVDSALILASGFGSRFVPLTFETPKGLLPVFNERMIERQIKQLHEVGIYDIAIMVGYLKEKFDYLIDKYDVKLIYNPEFSDKNTLATMYHARDFLRGRNSYILSSDNWMRENLFHKYEPYSWYAASFMEGETKEWVLTFKKNHRITSVTVGGKDAYCMYGPVFLRHEFNLELMNLIEDYYSRPGTENYYWEDVLIRNLKELPPIYVNAQDKDIIYEFENLEELRVFDEKYINDSGSSAMKLVSKVMNIGEEDIVNIKCLKAGMTNKSWLFTVRDTVSSEYYRGKSYICRIPGQGTDKLIDREKEGNVYAAVSFLDITEDLIYFDKTTGYKISRYYENSRNADFSRKSDRLACLRVLNRLHHSDISLNHDFSIRERLEFYEKLCMESEGGVIFEDFSDVRRHSLEVLDILDSIDRKKCLCHIDSVKDNFLFTDEGVRMIDWEYSGMADPMIDLGMSAIYSYMSFHEAREFLDEYISIDREHIDTDSDMVAQGMDTEVLYHIVIAYMGLGGLLWALWGIYKSSLGETFGDYTLKMYRYFKDSYKILLRDGFLQKIH